MNTPASVRLDSFSEAAESRRGPVVRWIRPLGLATFLLEAIFAANAADPPRFTDVQRTANNEVVLKVAVTTGQTFRLEGATELQAWEPVATLKSTGTGTNQFTDTAAPYLDRRFYRVVQLEDPKALTGDHFSTAAGDVLIHPVNHASFVMNWEGKFIYNDPVGGATPYAAFPRADLILVSHGHTDHYDSGTLNALKQAGTLIIAPAVVYSSLSAALKAITIPLAYQQSTNVLDLNVRAIPAYNSNHPRSTGNGYILTIGGRRIYMTGDTGDIAEMKALTDIDLAFVCINTPFTMSVAQASGAVRAFRPGIVYPYHYRNGDSSFANLNLFKQQVGADLRIEVRQRKWY